MDIAWILIIIAGILEPCWVYTMERSDGLWDIKWNVLTVAILIVDMFLISVCMKTIGAGLSYAIWTGLGAVFTFIMGIFIYKEKATMVRIIFIFMIITGIVGLNLVAGGSA